MMMRRFFSSGPFWQTAGLTFVRWAVGVFLIYHGWEIFNETKMNEYLQWDAIQKFTRKTIGIQWTSRVN